MSGSFHRQTINFASYFDIFQIQIATWLNLNGHFLRRRHVHVFASDLHPQVLQMDFRTGFNDQHRPR